MFKAGGAGMILYNNTDTDNLFTDNHWVPVGARRTSRAACRSRTTSPSTALADGADPIAAMTTKFKAAPSMTSSRRAARTPRRRDIIKPDITAPGLQILAGSSARSPTADGTRPVQLFQAIAGTSMSSPHVAGFYALLKQAHPDWSAGDGEVGPHDDRRPEVARQRPDDAGRPVRHGLGSCSNPGKVAKDKGSAFNPGLVYDAGFNDYLAFLCGADPERLRESDGDVCEPRRRRVLDRPERPQPTRRSASPTSPATQTVTRTVTSVADRTVTVEGRRQCAGRVRRRRRAERRSRSLPASRRRTT